jgi:LAGLIDADG endonuclease
MPSYLLTKTHSHNLTIPPQAKSFDFTLFTAKYKRLLNKTAPDFSFLTWFIGFTEGDGCFTVARRGDISFVITQNTKDIQVLNMIQNVLGFGKVIKQGKTTSRFVVQDKKGLYLLATLFNNNLVTHDKIMGFNKFLLALNKYIQKGTMKFSPLTNPSANSLKLAPIPTLEDSWFAGFSDSEGCFSVSVKSLGSGFNICFDIAQNHIENKIILDHFSSLFSVGKVYNHSSKGAYYYRVSGLKSTAKLFPYFDSHSLRSKKLKSYLLWKDLHYKLVNKDHLNPTLRYSLRVLASQVNNIWD